MITYVIIYVTIIDKHLPKCNNAYLLIFNNKIVTIKYQQQTVSPIKFVYSACRTRAFNICIYVLIKHRQRTHVWSTNEEVCLIIIYLLALTKRPQRWICTYTYLPCEGDFSVKTGIWIRLVSVYIHKRGAKILMVNNSRPWFPGHKLKF